MIERLLAAQRALDADQVDVAERLFGQVAAADPRNAMAVVGLARAARRRGDEAAAIDHARHALDVDPDDAAARRLLDELEAKPSPEPRPAPDPASEPAPGPAAIRAPAARESIVRRLLRALLGRGGRG